MQACKVEKRPTDSKDPLDKCIIVTPWDTHSSHSKQPSGCSSCARCPSQGHSCISDRLSWHTYPWCFCPGGSSSCISTPIMSMEAQLPCNRETHHLFLVWHMHIWPKVEEDYTPWRIQYRMIFWKSCLAQNPFHNGAWEASEETQEEYMEHAVPPAICIQPADSGVNTLGVVWSDIMLGGKNPNN